MRAARAAWISSWTVGSVSRDAAFSRAASGLRSPNLPEGPGSVAPDEGLGVGDGGGKPGDSRRVTQVAERHADIPEEAPALGPGDGAVPELHPELLLRQGQEGEEIRRVQPLPREEAGFGGNRGLRVVGADLLADVAAEDVDAHQRPEVARDGPLEFNGQVGDAATGIHDVGTHEGVGRTGLEAEGALATAVPDGRIRGEVQVGEQFP